MTVEPVAVMPGHSLENSICVGQAEAGKDERQGGKGDDRDPCGRRRQHYLAHAHRVALLPKGERQAQPAEDRDRRARQENAMILVVVGEVDNRRQQHGGAEETDDDAGEKEHRRQIDRRRLECASIGFGDSHR